MPPERPLFSTSVAHLQLMLTDDGSYTLRDSQLEETYHSGCGALAECLHVYLCNSGVAAKLERCGAEHRGAGSTAAPVRVLEFGFGTGMAFLLSIAAAQVNACPLEYVSLEHALLPAEVLGQLKFSEAIERAIQRGKLPPTYAIVAKLERDWLQFRSSLPARPPEGEIVWDIGQGNQLRLCLGDAVQYAASAQRQPVNPFDAIYFDAFSPATNPALWTEQVFENLSSILKPDGFLVSYCVSGLVRRALEKVGFLVERLPGPPSGKREVLVATQGQRLHRFD